MNDKKFHSTLVYVEADKEDLTYTDVALCKYSGGTPYVYPRLAYTEENKRFCKRVADELNKLEGGTREAMFDF